MSATIVSTQKDADAGHSSSLLCFPFLERFPKFPCPLALEHECTRAPGHSGTRARARGGRPLYWEESIEFSKKMIAPGLEPV